MAPQRTLQSAFADLINYRFYRLRNLSATPTLSEPRDVYKTKAHVDGFHPTLGTFDGFEPIKLLSFIATIKDAFDALEKTEGIAVHVLAFFLTEEAKEAYEAQISTATNDGALAATWPYVIHPLLECFLTKDVLREAYDAVAHTRQADREDDL